MFMGNVLESFMGLLMVIRLIGVIATKDGNHIADYFLLMDDYHRRGIGRNLFNVVLELK